MQATQASHLLWRHLLAVVFFMLTGCQGEPASPVDGAAKPASVPAASVWVGGLDGGVFVRVTQGKSAGGATYQATVHHSTGDLSYDGPVSPSPAGPIAVDLSKQESFEGWDGDTLYLKGGQKLTVQK
ncbi:MAG TPA: hypothetical protein VFV39_02600 [Limnobacter sp.]|nr:hypothetical protein [Limnobacter sp.]